MGAMAATRACLALCSEGSSLRAELGLRSIEYPSCIHKMQDAVCCVDAHAHAQTPWLSVELRGGTPGTSFLGRQKTESLRGCMEFADFALSWQRRGLSTSSATMVLAQSTRRSGNDETVSAADNSRKSLLKVLLSQATLLKDDVSKTLQSVSTSSRGRMPKQNRPGTQLPIVGDEDVFLVASLGPKPDTFSMNLVQDFQTVFSSGGPSFHHVDILVNSKSRGSNKAPTVREREIKILVPSRCNTLLAVLSSAEMSATDDALALLQATASANPGLRATVALVVLPLAFKGTKAHRQGQEVVAALRKSYSAVLVVDQSELLGRNELDLTLSAATRQAEQTAGKAMEALLHLMCCQDKMVSLVGSRDGALAPVLRAGHGSASSAVEATKAALRSPFLHSALSGGLAQASVTCLVSSRGSSGVPHEAVHDLLEPLIRTSFSSSSSTGGPLASLDVVVMPSYGKEVVEGPPAAQERECTGDFSATLILCEEGSKQKVRGPVNKQPSVRPSSNPFSTAQPVQASSPMTSHLSMVKEPQHEPASSSFLSMEDAVSLVSGRFPPEGAQRLLQHQRLANPAVSRRVLALLLEERNRDQAVQSSTDLLSLFGPRGSAVAAWPDRASRSKGGFREAYPGHWDASQGGEGVGEAARGSVSGSPSRRRIQADSPAARLGGGAGAAAEAVIGPQSPEPMAGGAPPREGLAQPGQECDEGEQGGGWWGGVKRTFGNEGGNSAGDASEEGSALRQRIQRVLDLERRAEAEVEAPTASRAQHKLKLAVVEVPYQGGVYIGTALDGAPQGMGILSFATGAFYKGDWVSGKRHGKGKNRSSSGTEYQGSWKHDKRHGKGTVLYPSGDTFEGTWREGQVQGWGVHSFSSGEAFLGWFKEDARHGPGLHLTNHDEVFLEVWEHGELLAQWNCYKA